MKLVLDDSKIVAAKTRTQITLLRSTLQLLVNTNI